MNEFKLIPQEKPITNNKLVAKIILILLVTFIILLVYFNWRENNLNLQNNIISTNLEYSNLVILDLFPQGIPIEAASSTVDMPRIISEGGKQITTFSYTSNNLSKDIIESYLSFFSSNISWGHVFIQDTSLIKELLVNNLISSSSIHLSINPNNTLNKNIVSITYIDSIPKISISALYAEFPNEDAVNINSQDKTYKDSFGNTVYSRSYVSSLSTEINNDVYLKYLKYKGWTQTRGDTDTDSVKNIIMTKNDSGIRVSISKITEAKSRVDIFVIDK